MAEKEENPAVVKAREAFEAAKGTESEFARQVEMEAAIIEDAEPAVGTAEATARAKEKVGHPDPFNTTGTVTADLAEDQAKAEAKAAKK